MKIVGKMLHIMRWSRPYILNSVHECSMMVCCTMESPIKAIKIIMKYVVTTADRGLLLKPDVVWNVGIYFLFEVTGMSNSNYSKDDS